MYNTLKDTIGEAYGQIQLFNKIAGNLEDLTPEHLGNQLSLIFEEFTETVDAFEAGDDKEYLDGLVDLLVTVSGALQQAEAAGFDVAEAAKRVCENNLSKFPIAHKPSLEFQPKDTEVFQSPQYEVYIFKDKNGKVKKPINYVPVNLEGTYPKGFLRGGE